MNFVLTREWLRSKYGSHQGENQVKQTRAWLVTYGKDVPPDSLDEWAKWKHLAEYQPNTPTIVEDCLAMIGQEFESELDAHRKIGMLRVPIAKGYDIACERFKPRTILELGVGGDSAISTGVFLYHIEKNQGNMISVDRSYLGRAADRYGKFPFWTFQKTDSVEFLERCTRSGIRYDMVFIDTIHSFSHTYKELTLSSSITNVILMDDITFEGNDFDDLPGGVKRAIEEWGKAHPEWAFEQFQPTVGVFTK